MRVGVDRISRALWTTVLALAGCLAATGWDAAAEPGKTASPGSRAAAQRGLTAADCRRLLVAHEPAADVAYKPGVDAYGRPVVPADLGSGYDLDLPEEIRIPIGVDVYKAYGHGSDIRYSNTPDDGGAGTGWHSHADANLYTGTASIGTVTVREGKAYFNDRLLAPKDQVAITEACRRAGVR